MKTILYFLISFCFLATACKGKKETAPAMPPLNVLVNTPEKRDITYTYEYPAYLQAIQTVNLVARVSGFLENILYDPGQTVKAGDLLFVIEPQPYADQLDAAKAQYESADAKLIYAKAQYEKMKEAMPSRAVSEIEFIQAESDYHAALAARQDAKALLNTARNNLTYCYIKAPFDGKVSRNLVDKANFVSGSMQPVTLATMYRDKEMYAYFNMAYAEFQNLPPVNRRQTTKDTSMLLTVTDAANPGHSWKGYLDYTAPGIDLQTGTVAVRATVANPREELLSGMYVKISVPYKQVAGALLIPEASIGTNQGGRFIYIVGKDNRVEPCAVTVGMLGTDGMREIIKGVTDEDRYVVEALMTVRPGMQVNPVTHP